ncbi:hypothetical protein OK006_10393 [Actinobacteria bacterium OK006]|nr:hypothetical protein OK006_10393 [Actinobacteria bacterium OK006]
MTDALERDARTLLKEYDGGGVPEYGGASPRRRAGPGAVERVAFRAWLRDVPEFVRAGRLIDVLDPAAVVLESAGISGYGRRYTGFFVTAWIAAGGGSS